MRSSGRIVLTTPDQQDRLHDRITFENEALFDDVRTRRIIAYIIDLVILAGITAISFVLLLFWLAPLFPLVYHSFFIGRYGATPGQSMLDLEVRSMNGEKPDYIQACIATTLFYLSITITSSLILVVSLFNPQKRTMHDYFSSTVVVRHTVANSVKAATQ